MERVFARDNIEQHSLTDRTVILYLQLVYIHLFISLNLQNPTLVK